MILNLSQPRVYPHITYLDKIASSELFVVSDDLVVKKNLFEIRNKYHCRLSNSSKYINIPIESKTVFKELKIRETGFTDKHRKILYDNYKRYKYFDNDILEQAIPRKEYKWYLDYFNDQLSYFIDLFDIDTQVRYASEVGSRKQKTERINEILKHHKATLYVSGVRGADYLTNLDTDVIYHKTFDSRFSNERDNGSNGDMLMVFDDIFSKGLDNVKNIIDGKNLHIL